MNEKTIKPAMAKRKTVATREDHDKRRIKLLLEAVTHDTENGFQPTPAHFKEIADLSKLHLSK